MPKNKSAENLRPPRPEQIPYVHKKFRDHRSDPYFWMRERENPKLIKHLENENKYAEAALRPVKVHQRRLFQEMKARIQQQYSTSVSVKDGFAYYFKYVKGGEHPIYCRKKIVSEAADTGILKLGPEIKLLDGNKLSKGKDYFKFGSLEPSPDGKSIAYTVDYQGRRQYSLYVFKIPSKKTKKIDMANLSPSVFWAHDSSTIFYATNDPETLRTDRVFRHVVSEVKGTEIYFEKDPMFSVDLEVSFTRKFLFLVSSATLTTEYRWIPLDHPDKTPVLFEPRELGHAYELQDKGQDFLIRTNWKSPNFRLMSCPRRTGGRKTWKELIPHRPKVLLESFLPFQNNLVTIERENGLNRIFHRSFSKLRKRTEIPSDHDVFHVEISSDQDFSSDFLKYFYSSPVQPLQHISFHFKSQKKTVLWQQEVPTYRPKLYQTTRFFVPVRDGTKVPVTLIWKKSKRKKTGNPTLIYGYGSYGFSLEPGFSSVRTSLLDRGFVWAIAHVRGGQEMGRHWYDQGKLQNKMNTFYDFIDVTKNLVKTKISDPSKIFALGESAGGLLMGAVANLQPDLYRGIIAKVPFVDNLTTMLDETIPLTTFEYTEWGNPNQVRDYHYMRKYSVYDNITRQSYPAMLVMTGFHDSQVQYWEPAKWVARLRDLNLGTQPVLFLTNMKAGHAGSSGRFQALEEKSLEFTFILWQSRLLR